MNLQGWRRVFSNSTQTGENSSVINITEKWKAPRLTPHSGRSGNHCLGRNECKIPAD